jgi:di/tricarboxylate transporter
MSALSSQEWILIGFIVATLIAIVFDLLRPDLVAILVLALLPLTGILTVQEAFSGFSRSVVITIIGLFIMTQALEDTGVVQWMAERLKEVGAGSEGRLILLFMGAGAGLSLVMNNIAAGAVLLPAAVQVGRESNVPPSKLLIPLSFGTLVGGMATYFTTANIILSSILHDQGEEALSMIDFIPTGGLIVLMGLFFMWLIGRHMLPSRESVGHSATPALLSRQLTETYQIEEQLWEVHVLPASRLVGVPLSRSEIGEELGMTVVAIWRGQQEILNPEPAEMIKADDYLVVLGRDGRLGDDDWPTAEPHGE